MFYDRIQLLLETGRFDMAEQEARRMIAEDQEDALMQIYLAYSLLGQKRTVEAEEEVKRAIAMDPDFPLSHKMLSQLYYQQGDLDASIEAIEEAIRLDPEAGGYHVFYGYILFAQRKWEDALDSVEKGLSLDPEDTDGINLRARILVKLDRSPEASSAFDASLDKDPDNPMTHANLGWALLEEGEYKKSLNHFRESLRLDPNNEAGRSGLIEALKAKYWIYRAYLKFSFFMGNLSTQYRWALVIGAILIVQIFPPLLPLYLGLIFFSWFSEILFNTLLRLNPYGRYALNEREIRFSNIFSILLVGGIISLVSGMNIPNNLLEGIGVVCLGMLFPVTGTYTQHRQKLIRKSLVYTLILAIVGVGFIGAKLLSLSFANTIFTVFLFGAVGYTWWIGFVSEK